MKLFKNKTLALILTIIMLFSLVLASCDKKQPEKSGEGSSSSIEITSSSIDESSSDDESSGDESSNEGTSSEGNDNYWDSDADEELKKEVDALLESKHTLMFNDDGTFRILILADVHMTSTSDAIKVQKIKDRIKMLVDRENPNLVIFTGDNTIGSSSADSLRANINAMVSYIEEREIPWCHVYGNHDHEGGYANVLQQDVYESFDYCISKTGPDISGVGNYVHAVYNKDGSIGAVIYCLDSGAYAVGGGYDYIKEDQIAWYEDVSTMLEEYNGGKVIPSMMAFHIPLIENNEAHNNRDNPDIVYEYTGEKNENICSSATDTELLETIFERGDVKAIVTGHDHINDYMYNYKGVILSSSPNFSDLTYTDAAVQGARVFKLTSNDGALDIETFVSYIISRLNPDDFEDLGSNIGLEFTENAVENATITNWNGGALSGNVDLSIASGRGANDSNALSIARDSIDNFELSFAFTSAGKLGTNKYLVVWADFSGVEFRKACFGLLSADGHAAPFRTDDADYKSTFYYLADGETEWTELSHGGDGCFGVGDSGSQGMLGKKGYFAIPVEHIRQGSKSLSSDSLVSGFYFYASLNSGAHYNVPFYIDDVYLVEDYTQFSK